MSKREPSLLVCDMIESAESILSFTAGMTYEQFLEDKKTRDAVVRNLKSLAKRPIACPMISKRSIRISTGSGYEACETELFTITLASTFP